MSVLWLESRYTMKYSLSPWEIPQASPPGFPSVSSYILSYIPPLVTIPIQYSTVQYNFFLDSLRPSQKTKLYNLEDFYSNISYTMTCFSRSAFIRWCHLTAPTWPPIFLSFCLILSPLCLTQTVIWSHNIYKLLISLKRNPVPVQNNTVKYRKVK